MQVVRVHNACEIDGSLMARKRVVVLQVEIAGWLTGVRRLRQVDKRETNRDRMRRVRQGRPERKISRADLEVLRLAFAGYGAPEIAEALDISQTAAYAAFERVADFLGPTAVSQVSIAPHKCLPFSEQEFDEAPIRRTSRRQFKAPQDLRATV